MDGAVPRYQMTAAIALAGVAFVLLAALCDQSRGVAIPLMGAWVGLVAAVWACRAGCLFALRAWASRGRTSRPIRLTSVCECPLL